MPSLSSASPSHLLMLVPEAFLFGYFSQWSRPLGLAPTNRGPLYATKIGASPFLIGSKYVQIPIIAPQSHHCAGWRAYRR